MGGWALWICQSVHEDIVGRSGLGDDSRVRDRRTPPPTGMCHTEYVDNLIVMGSDEKSVKEAYSKAVSALKGSGLQVHEEEVGGDGAEILGWEIGARGHFRPTRKRAWKVRLAIRGLLATGRASSKQLEKVVGHCSFLCLGRREAFSIFGQVYSFIQRYKFQTKEVALWKSVRRELDIFDGIIPLIQRDLCLQWDGRIHAVDASEWGLGVTSTDIGAKEARSLGQINERWRFRELGSHNPRQQVLEGELEDLQMFVANHSDEPSVVGGKQFNSVPFEVVSREWATVGRHKWKGPGTLPVYEARSSLYAIKHILRSAHNFGKKHVILSDSMTAVCSLARGRAQTFQLRHVCAQVAALSLCTNTSFHPRWIPSEWNPADNPSRGVWKPSVADRWLGHGSPQESADWATVEMERSQSKEPHWKASQSAKSKKRTCPETSDTESLGDPDRDEFKFKEAEEGSQSLVKNKSHLDKRQSNSARGGLGFQSLSSEVSYPLVEDESFGAGCQRADQGSSRGGQECDAISGGNVLRGRGCEHSAVCGGVSPISCPVFEVSPDESLTKSKTKPERVEENLPRKISIAGALGSGLPSGATCGATGVGAFLPSYDGDVCTVSSAERNSPSSSEGFGEACQNKRIIISLVELCPPPLGAGRAVQDPGVRRDIGPRFGLSPKPGAGDRQILQNKQQSNDRSDLQSQPHRVESVFARSGSAPSVGTNRCDSCLPVSPWGGVSRLSRKASRPGRDTATGAVEVSGKCSAISERNKTGTVVRQSIKGSSKAVQQSRKRKPTAACQPALKPCRHLRSPVFLEVFSGTGRLGKCISKDNNWPTLLWDISLGEEYDLRRRSNRWKITGWMRAGLIQAGHLGTPCHSFSRARDRRPGPPPLRSDDNVMGLPGLRPGDQQKVSEGNLFMRFSCSLMVLASTLGIAFTMENPARSRIWLCPAVLRMLRRRHICLHFCEFCMFGTRWRKSTAFASVFLNLDCLEQYRCLGAKRGLCKRSGLPHIHLCGQAPSGQWMTHLAEPYPWKLCHVLAGAFADHAAQARAEQFQRRLWPEGI